MQLLHTVAVFAAAASTAQAAGTAYIYNLCPFNAYLWPVDATRSPSTPQTIPPGGTFSEPFHTPPTGGVSLKLSKTTSIDKITQLEYTLLGSLWYDGSNVNCQGTDCPFQAEGLYMETSDPACPTRICPPGAPTCTGFYTLWNDDQNSLMCGATSDLKLYLCSTSANLPSPAAAAAAAPSALPGAGKAAAAAPATPPKGQQNEAVVSTFLTFYNKPTPRAEPLHRRHVHHHQH